MFNLDKFTSIFHFYLDNLYEIYEERQTAEEIGEEYVGFKRLAQMALMYPDDLELPAETLEFEGWMEFCKAMSYCASL